MILGIIIGLIVLTLLVLVHEWGHFIAAKKNGVKVNEFGIGFPPRAIGWIKKDGKWVKLKKSEWDKPQKSLILSINWLPIGGFCAMDGESDADVRKGTFGAATFWQKTKILFAGVTMNWLVAFIILTILAVTGMPEFIDNQFFLAGDNRTNPQPILVGEVLDGSPAHQAGLIAGDKIIAIADRPVDSARAVAEYNQAHPGETVTYEISRNDELKTVSVTLNPADAPYLLGITMSESNQVLHYATWSAPIVGAVTTVQLTGETFRGLMQMIWNLGSGLARQFSPDDSTRQSGREDIGKVGDSISGPVAIVGIFFPNFTAAGPTNLAFLAAVISISLACMNVLPIPALDGGRWLLIAIYRLRKKKLTTEIEANIVSRAFVILIALIVLITILDIARFFK